MCIGAETFAPSISNVVFRDIDVIRTTDVFMDILHGNKAAVSDITFENIRAGIDDHTPEPVFQTEKGQVYADPNRGYVPRLMSISIAPNGWLPDGTLGTVDRVTYKNVTVYGSKRPASDFMGNSAVHRIDGVEIDNLVIGGTKATDARVGGARGGRIRSERAVPLNRRPYENHSYHTALRRIAPRGMRRSADGDLPPEGGRPAGRGDGLPRVGGADQPGVARLPASRGSDRHGLFRRVGDAAGACRGGDHGRPRGRARCG